MSKDINLRLPKVKAITGLSTSTIWRLERENKFPIRRRIGKRAIAWIESEIQQWIEESVKQRPGHKPESLAQK